MPNETNIKCLEFPWKIRNSNKILEMYISEIIVKLIFDSAAEIPEILAQ